MRTFLVIPVVALMMSGCGYVFVPPEDYPIVERDITGTQIIALRNYLKSGTFP